MPFELAPKKDTDASSGAAGGSGAFAISARRAALQFLPRRAIVHGTVGGLSTYLLVDTGASRHFLEGWFGKRIVLWKNGRALKVEDAASHSVASSGVDRPDVAIDGWGALGKDQVMLTSEADYAGEAQGIGVLLSPQRLLSDDAEAIVLDLPAREMRLGTWADAESQYGEPSFRGSMNRCGTYSVATTIDKKPVELMLDTGADTLLYTTRPTGQALEGRSQPTHASYGVGGPMSTRVVTGVEIGLGKRQLRLDLRLIESRAPSCSGEGLLGMDALNRCVLILGASRMFARCE